MNDSRKIFMVAYDWNNIFQDDPQDLINKLKRDRLKPYYNSFYYLSWGKEFFSDSLKVQDTDIESLHLYAFSRHLRPIFDFMSSVISFFLLLMMKEKPDVILVYSTSLVTALAPLKYFFGVPIFLYQTNIPGELLKTRKFSLIKKYYQQIVDWISGYIADQVITINKSSKEYLRERGFDTNLIHVFYPLTVERDKELFDVAESGIVHKEHNVRKDAKILLSVGRLDKEKAFDLLIRSFAKLDRNDLVLIILGEGPCRKELEGIVTGLELKDSVFLPGWIDRKSIGSYFKDADVFILLSKTEGLGLVVWEAMYTNTPVIGSYASGIVESIGSNQERGYLWDGNNIEEFREYVHQCINQPQEVKIKIKRAKEYVLSHFDSDKYINDLFTI